LFQCDSEGEDDKVCTFPVDTLLS